MSRWSMPRCPGMLPVINEECVRQAVRTGLGLKREDQSQIGVRPEELFLSRPAAGLPDQPVQIADRGRGRGDSSTCRTARPSRVGIERLHLEQDAGKSLHDQHPTMSLVDLNRSGVALMEIVSKPDLRSAEEAKAFSPSCARSCATSAPATATWRRAICAPTSTSRCASPARRFGTRCEIKNVNSIRFIGQAIEHEARRQIEHHRGRRHDRAGDAAVRSRQGRDALDALQGGGARLPLLPRSGPAAARTRAGTCRRAQGAPAGTAGREEGALRARLSRSRPTTPDVLVAERETAEYFEACRRAAAIAKLAANWVINELDRAAQQGRHGDRGLAGDRPRSSAPSST